MIVICEIGDRLSDWVEVGLLLGQAMEYIHAAYFLSAFVGLLLMVLKVHALVLVLILLHLLVFTLIGDLSLQSFEFLLLFEEHSIEIHNFVLEFPDVEFDLVVCLFCIVDLVDD